MFERKQKESETPKIIDRFRNQYEFLSNFYPIIVNLDGDTYESVEHAFQAAKTLDSQKREPFKQGIVGYTASEAKRAGRNLQLREDWESIKDNVMLDLLRQKFEEPGMKTLLLATGEAELIEGNWWGDTYWGVCNGVGENKLGKLLMQIRTELKKTENL